MISKKMEGAIGDQINRELYSAYLYLSMADYAEAQNLKGFSVWMQKQAAEEVAHAMKFHAYLGDQGARAKLKAIDAPPANFKSPTAIFRDALAHEKKVTGHINDLMEQAVAEKDHASQIMLQWFITEQIEEEATAGDILAKLERIGDDPRGLFMIDRELAARGAQGQ